MLTREQILERIKVLDLTGEEINRIEAETRENRYPLRRYKEMVTEVAINLEASTTEDALALLAREFFVAGFMDTLNYIADEAADIIVYCRQQVTPAPPAYMVGGFLY